MHFAVFNKHNDVVKLLLKWYADTEIKGFAGQIPLILAAEINNAEAVKILIKNGAYMYAKDDSENTALDYSKQNNTELVNFLTKCIKGRKIAAKHGEVFIEAIRQGDYNEIKKYIGMGKWI